MSGGRAPAVLLGGVVSDRPRPAPSGPRSLDRYPHPKSQRLAP
ncbi:CUTA isoform 9 [Pan troglodytes]|uniref:CutA divalent cation tolerance homolog n=2 Tax=Homininae TaxID=207598 RepID=F2Z2Q5_HUMAN|nr:CUTA isoform 9 [Pan troglodytes]